MGTSRTVYITKDVQPLVEQAENATNKLKLVPQ